MSTKASYSIPNEYRGLGWLQASKLTALGRSSPNGTRNGEAHPPGHWPIGVRSIGDFLALLGVWKYGTPSSFLPVIYCGHKPPFVMTVTLDARHESAVSQSSPIDPSLPDIQRAVLAGPSQAVRGRRKRLISGVAQWSISKQNRIELP
ncbi:hypothetical protein VTN96DRAFT_996 [Rasamsonia emersonii]